MLYVLAVGLGLSIHAQSMQSAHAGAATPCIFVAKEMPDHEGDASKTVAEATVEAWIDCMYDRPIVIPKMRLETLLETKVPGSNAPLPYYLSRTEGPFSLTIGMKRKIHPSMSAEDVNASIAFVANDGFPMPGLEVDYWQVHGLTRSSHSDVRHTVSTVNETGIVLLMEMEIFAIHGLARRAEYVPDKPTEPHAYFNIDLVQPLKVTLQLEIENFQR